MAKLVKPLYFESVVNAGEKRLLDYLEVKLPEDYYLIPNVEIASTNPRNNRTQFWEYDLVVIAPHAIFNVENKDWHGYIEGDDHTWYLNDHQRRNPHKTNRQKSAILASTLKSQQSVWGKAWVQGLVSLSYGNSFPPQISGESAKLTFELTEDLIDFLTDPYNVGKTANDIMGIQQEIVKFLTGQQSRKRPDEKREVQGFEILKILEQEENFAEYLVRPKGNSTLKRRVKEYALQVNNLTREELRQREEQIKNQYTALNRLKSKNFILNVEFRPDPENHLFYEISDYLEENTLRAEARVKTYTFKEKVRIIENLLVALQQAHKEGIFHRDINPNNVYLINGYAYLGNFGKSYFVDHNEQGYTVMPTLNEQNATAYHPLELTVGDASALSDIYSLGVLIYWLFTDKEPFRSPYDLNKMGGSLPEKLWPSSLNQNIPEWVDEVCKKTILTDEFSRIGSVEELQNFIKEATQEERSTSSKTEEDQIPSGDLSLQDLKEGDTVDEYIIHKVLGKGGYSRVFEVEHKFQNKFFALKLFNESVQLNSVIDEYRALTELNHPNIVAFKWNGQTSNGQFYTLMELLEGENLRNYGPHTDVKLPIHKVYQVGKEILSALVEMQSKPKPLLHRDIKPQNIIWDKGERFVLIDFNVASADETDKNFVGTSPYLAPDIIDGHKINWNLSADTFALGVTLYELICKKYPWHPSKMPVASRAPNNPRDFEERISDEFADFLLKSIELDPNKRFRNAKEMLEALLAIEENLLAEKEEEDYKISIRNKTYHTEISILQGRSRYKLYNSMNTYLDLGEAIKKTLENFKKNLRRFRPELDDKIKLHIKINDEIIVSDYFWQGGAKRYTDGTVEKVYQSLKELFDKNKSKIKSQRVDIEGLNIVDYINSLYSQSQYGNFGTRVNEKGSDFDELTYTPTKLDKKLIPDILSAKYKLLIITGNAGDGKTAFIKRIEREPAIKKSLEHFEHKNGARFSIDGITYESNYDGSQDEEEKANNEVLEQFFNPFEGLDNYEKASEGRIIAINEGRLVEFLTTSTKHKKLARVIENYFYEEGHTKLPEGLMIVNLNLRSVVASENDTDSLFKQQVKALTRPSLWEGRVPGDSFIRYNVDTLNDSAAGETVINRLEWLLRTVSLKRELHITMRDIRSFISFLITRDVSLEDLPRIEALKQTDPIKYWQYYYFNITNPLAEDTGNQDRLIKLLRETDIGEVAIPHIDRELFFNNHLEKDFVPFAERETNLLETFNAHKQFVTAQEQTPGIIKAIREKHKSFVRHHYFEGKITWSLENPDEENPTLEADKPSYLQRLPYKSIFDFVSILSKSQVGEKTKQVISRAVSLNEGSTNNELSDKNLVLSSNEVRDYKGKSFKLFPLEDFELLVNNTVHLTQYLEYEPDSLIFRHKEHKRVQLSISLDLYEMLYYIKKGFSPSLNDLKGKFVELTIFKNLLQNLNYNEVVVTSDNREFYLIRKVNTKLSIQKMTV